MIGHPQLRPGGAVSAQTAAQERYPLRHIAILDLAPPAIEGSLRTPNDGKPCSVVTATSWSAHSSKDYVVSDERKQNSAKS